MSTRIVAKRWDNDKDQIITHVKLEDGRVFPMIAVWNDITYKGLQFHTFENNVLAKVYAKTNSFGVKYITTSPDGTKNNNLDELPSC